MHTQLIVALTLGLSQACSTKSVDGPSSKSPAAAPSARISLEAARGTALGRIPGKVVEEELEQEHGRLVYSFEIQPDEPNSKLKEVHVDANDGSIVAVEDEEAEDDKDDKDDADDKEDDDKK